MIKKLKAKKSFKERIKDHIELFKYSMKNYWFLYLIILPGAITVVIYKYGPMILQAILAFTEYNFADGIFGSPFVGINNFKILFTEVPTIGQVIKNTVFMSIGTFACGFFPPLILAVMLFDLQSSRFRKFAQTIVYIPHFFSWVIVFSIVYGLLSNSGLINSLISRMGSNKIDFLLEPKAIRWILLITYTWKNIGWGTIIYLAAMQGIDVNLYDAAKIDGCGPFRRIFAVTLPSIRHITFFLLILAMGGLLSGGDTQQILLFYNPSTYAKADTIGTWIYRDGFLTFDYSLGASLSFLQSTIGMILVLIANKISTKKVGVGIW